MRYEEIFSRASSVHADRVSSSHVRVDRESRPVSIEVGPF